MNLTILTATYNRAHTLERLYESLVSQSDLEFEWLVIDDGSTDETNQVIERFKNFGYLDITYYQKTNEGKHSALNLGFRLSKGDWIFVVDSDDWLDFDCIENVRGIINSVKDQNRISSICMLQREKNGLIVGNELNLHHMNYLEMIESNILGDKCDVFKKSFVEKFSYPVYPNEKFMSELPLYIYLSKISSTHFVNYCGYNCEYNIGGLSDQSIKLRYNNVNSTLFVYKDLYLNSFHFRTKLRAAANWWRFSVFNSANTKKNINSWRAPVIISPIGFILFILDKLKAKI